MGVGMGDAVVRGSMDGFVVPPVSTEIPSSHTTAILASTVRPCPFISIKQLLLQLLFPACSKANV